tara:strand:- start:812 stop:1285 length:474 start_codon:yes stop_codon:yes gene_type:complete
MSKNYLNIYNNLINLTRNKNLYKDFAIQDTFSDRLILFLFHFAFFLKVFKINNEKKILQNIYDDIFRYLELSIREMGYGDVTINKKMKIYINNFHSILDKINDWESLSYNYKEGILITFTNKNYNNSYLVDYFDKYIDTLKKSSLNSYLKGVITPKF